MSRKLEDGIFLGYIDDCFQFETEYGNSIRFHEVNPRVVEALNLKKNTKLIGKKFLIIYSERLIGKKKDDVVYRIENLIIILE